MLAELRESVLRESVLRESVLRERYCGRGTAGEILREILRER
jgi:hypothetical protein